MVQIKVFPESGHHYTFVPFENDVLTKYPKLRQLCAQGRHPWSELNYKWVRGRFAMKDVQPGMWVAVESNLGSVERGSLYEPRRQAGAPHSLDNNSPYAAPDLTRLPGQPQVITIQIPSPTDSNTLVDVAQLEVIWQRPAGKPIDVDLIVDFGNTRTVVLALENLAAQDGKLASVCRPVRFIKQPYNYEATEHENLEDTCTIVDSWFVLHETIFSNLEPPSPHFKSAQQWQTEETVIEEGFFPKKKRIDKHHFVTARVPQMFIELSPLVMGNSARQILGNLHLEAGGNYSMSSPKRYVWDSDIVGKEGGQWWTMVLNRWNPESASPVQLPKLAGSLLRFIYSDGRDWVVEQPPNEDPNQAQRPVATPPEPAYPRSATMTWAALSVIELAYRQITSAEWRKGNHEFVPRRLRNVIVTYPSGWSIHEVGAYKTKWETALNIFTIAHLRNRKSILEGGDRPQLVMDLDEAVASQLPFVYSEILRLGNMGENWIELFGRGKGGEARVRIMTVDIGGGTTDISIVEYADMLEGAGVNLKAELLFRDSSSVAGDALVKEIIECVLLPKIGERYLDNPTKTEIYNAVFSGALKSAGLKAKWSRIVKLVFLPIVRQWLSDLAHGTYGCPETGGPWAPERIMGVEGRLVDEGALRELNEFFKKSPLKEEVLGDADPIGYPPEQVEECISRVFSPVIRSLAKYVAAFDVDLITLSGKPSELPPVRRLLEDLLPILPQRIIQARNFPAGDWYPMATNNKIRDAKTVTAVGAALAQAIKNGNIDGWGLSATTTEMFVSKNYWGAMPTRVQPTKFGRIYLRPEEDMATVPILIGTCIGRKILPSGAKPEQVYRFRWKNKEEWIGVGVPLLQVTIQRLAAEDKNSSESLSISQVDGQAGNRKVTSNDVELQLCTLEGEDFWQDTGRFEVVWPTAP